VAADTGGPATGLAIFGKRSFLQKQTAVWVKEPKVNGTVKKPTGMNLGAWG